MSDEQDEPVERSDIEHTKMNNLLSRLVPGQTVVVLMAIGIIVIIGGSDAIN